MKAVAIIGVDLAKQFIWLNVATAEGDVLSRKKLSRKEFRAFMQMQPTCRFVMQSCASAHHWAQTLTDLGHDVRPIVPKFFKPEYFTPDITFPRALCRAIFGV